MMVGVYVVSFGCLCFIFDGCVGVLRVKLSSISLQTYMCMFFCVWKLQVHLIFKILCDMCLSSCIRFMDLMPCVPFRYCVLHVFCVFNHPLFCCVSYLLQKFYFLCGLRLCVIWLICGWCFMFLISCCQI